MIPAIEATALGKRYRSQWALRDCCLQIPTGRITALVGPNGAGKTTLLKLAMGVLAPDAGSVRVLGWSPIEHPTLVLSRVGYVPQDRPLYERFTVADMLRLGRELTVKWDEKMARDRLVAKGIPLDRQIRKLSGGQQAQVSLALAVGKRPELLLLDEPASNLDPLARREFLSQLVDAVAADGLTAILSSHIIADVDRVCDYLVILSGGSVQVAGDIDSLLEDHKLLLGPPIDPEMTRHDASVVRATHTARESALLVKTAGVAPPSTWRAEAVGLEDLVLAYLENPAARSIPGPSLTAVDSK